MSKRQLYIIGAGGFATEVYEYLTSSVSHSDNYSIVGFLDDNLAALDNYNYEHKVVGGLFNDALPQGSLLVLSLAQPSLKKKLYSFYKSRGFEFMTFIHPTAVVGKNVVVGEGTIIGPNTTLTTNIELGILATINAHSSIGHDATLGDYCTLSGHCDVTGNVELSDEVYMGSHALIIPSVKVGTGAIIGAGSVVINKVKPGVTMFGNPAKKIK